MSDLEPLRERLVALLDEYDAAPRGSSDHLLAAYMRACLSSRDALELRVARRARMGPEPGLQHWSTRRVHGSLHPISMAPMFADDPRPDATLQLAMRVRQTSLANAAQAREEAAS